MTRPDVSEALDFAQRTLDAPCSGSDESQLIYELADTVVKLAEYISLLERTAPVVIPSRTRRPW